MATRLSKSLTRKLAKKSGVQLTSVRANKFGAVSQKVDGYTFDSKKEARRYGELKLMVMGGLIKDLRVHPVFYLHAGPVILGKAEFDFSYLERPSARRVVEDCKGGEATNTALSKWKRKHAEAEHGIKVRLV